jgi:predicted anti-sigma-YlaC factor YlaD
MKRPLNRSATTAVCAIALSLGGCSIKTMAINSLGNALASGTSSFATDDDPELVRDAVPFGLKTIESLLTESPRHKGLLFAAASGFTQYAYAFLQQEADFVEAQDLARATALRTRARRLFLRGRDYGFRGLDQTVPGFEARLRKDSPSALAGLRKEHVGLLYWTGAAWFAAISISKGDSELTADQQIAEKLLARSLALDETYELGAVHDFYISWEGRGEAVGGSPQRAREHCERAVAISKGRRAWPYVSLAEAVSVPAQDRKEFDALLEKALAIDPNAAPEVRLTNVVAQRRALWLKGRVEELFVE